MRGAAGSDAAATAALGGNVTAAASTRAAPPERILAGPVRLGRRTKDLTGRLAPRSIALLDHPDLDAVAARALVRARPLAVLNNQPSITGRYPNRGPSALLEAGVPLFDLYPSAPPEGGDDTLDLFALLKDGEPVVIRGDGLFRPVPGGGETRVAQLLPLTAERVAARLEAARANLDRELLSFAGNTLEFLRRDEERALLLDPVAALPPVRTDIAGRHVLIAVRGESYEDDLARLGRYLREQRPVVIAVDGAADTLLEAGVRPDIILGDMDSVSDAALRCGAELVVHAYAAAARKSAEGDGAAPGLNRLRALNLDTRAHIFAVPGTSEDAALLLAYEKGADLIVAVGTHTNLEDFLDKGRKGMASTFLVRLKVGSRLVDARGVSRLYARGERLGPLIGYLLLAAFFPIGVLLASTVPGRAAWDGIVLWFRLSFHR